MIWNQNPIPGQTNANVQAWPTPIMFLRSSGASPVPPPVVGLKEWDIANDAPTQDVANESDINAQGLN